MSGTVGAVQKGEGEGEGTCQKEGRGHVSERKHRVLPQQGCNNRCVFVSIIEDVHRSVPI